MGILDFVNTPAGMGLLSGVASYAANARRGTPVNNIGRGLAGGLTGYNAGVQGIKQAEQDKVEQAYKNTMMQAQMMNAITAQENARRKAEQEKVGDDQAKFVFASLGFDPDNMDEQIGGFMNVGREDQPLTASPIPNPGEGEYKLLNQEEAFGHAPKPMQAKQPNINALFSRLGWGNEEIEMFRAQAAADPKGASKFLFDSMKDVQRANLKGKTEARDYIAKERAMAKAMGMDVGDYFKAKMNKGPGVVVNNILGEPKPVTLPDGSQALMRFPKGGGEPVIVKGAMPPATDSEQMASGYGSRMNESERIIKNVGKKGFPTVGTSVAGALPGDLGRFTQSLAMSPEQQMHRQAQEDWVRAKLRKESGAVIADEEMNREISTYFPKPGDTPQVIKQKEAARETAIKAMNRAAGPARQSAPFTSKAQQKPANPSSGWSIQKVQ